MKINLQNYEAYLLDYLEGNLNQVMHRQVEDFLDMHPEISDEIEGLELQTLADDETKFSNSPNLLKTYEDVPDVNENNFEEHCIAYYEGELSEDRKQKLLSFIEGNTLRKALFQLHARIHFKPDTLLHFSGKKELIHPVKRILSPWIYSAAAAAAIILLIFVIGRGGESATETLVNKFQPEEMHTVPVTESQSNEENSVVKDEKMEEMLEQKLLNNSYNTLAAFDTNDTRKQEKVILAQIQPRVIELTSPLDEAVPDEKKLVTDLNEIYLEENISSTTDAQQDEDQLVLGRNKEDLIVGAISMGLKGFNSLTENSLAIVAEKDESGKIKSYSLGNERFGFRKKVRENL